MMTLSLVVIASLIILLIVGTVRVVKGPTAADRMLAAMLIGTTSVAVVVLLALVLTRPMLVDVALVLAALAAVAMVAFTQDSERSGDSGADSHAASQ
ncbi:MAG: pH regulation protein F [Planctomycetes bacterium]|nr:pH regulation protein F [Planctomycetota bacterium]